ncbi:FMRF-amide neuropeptides-like [Lineus longissimus]|uniref:FMRF-amide neuropeptides-like n=1 Tax=Lineus longissimus TaxID=88925 RepID=UPI002B4C3738
MYILYLVALLAGQAIATDFNALCSDPKLNSLKNFMVLCDAFRSFSDNLNDVSLDSKRHRATFIRYGRDASHVSQENALETHLTTPSKRNTEGYMRFGRSVKDPQPAQNVENVDVENTKKEEEKKAIPSTAVDSEQKQETTAEDDKAKRYMRFGRNNYIRFGRESEEADDDEIDDAKRYMRFGKKDDAKRYMRFGKKNLGPVAEEEGEEQKRYMRFGKKDGSDDAEKRYMRFGKRYMRFGKREDDLEEDKRYMRFGKKSDDEKRYMRFGKKDGEEQDEKRYMRFGKKSDEDEKRYMRFGRGDEDMDADKRYMRFGKRYMRFGKRYMRFGKRDEEDANEGGDDEKRYMRFGKRYMRFGKRDTPIDEVRKRNVRSVDESKAEKAAHMRYRRSEGPDGFERDARYMRFGRNPNGATVDGYIRFGRLLDGEDSDETEETPAKRYMRFGRDYLRFGRLLDGEEESSNDNQNSSPVQKRFIRLGRLFGGLGVSKEELQRRYLRNNRDRAGGYMRFGRSEPAGGYMRFGK